LCFSSNAFANVFPVPGGPTSKGSLEFYHQDWCIFLGFQEFYNFLYFFLAPNPATSLNVVLISVFHQKFCFWFSMNIWPPPP
jgi:hypothetical protein